MRKATPDKTRARSEGLSAQSTAIGLGRYFDMPPDVPTVPLLAPQLKLGEETLGRLTTGPYYGGR